jgi:multiple sugar transport system permease protein
VHEAPTVTPTLTSARLAPTGGKRAARLRRWNPGALAYLLVVAYAAALLLPLYFVVVSSFKTNETIFLEPLSPPTTLSFAKYGEAQSAVDLGGALLNSVIVTLAAEIVTLLLALPAAYGIARHRGRLGKVIETIFGVGFLIPTFAVLVPTFLLAAFSDLLYSRIFLILFYPATVLPLSVILLAQFMRTVPRELEESAMIDGATRMQILRHVFIPLVIPGIASVAILNFLAFWNEYIFALILTNDASRTVQVAVPALRDSRLIDYALLSAGIVIALVPVYIVYTVLQRRMQEAMLVGAIKG